MKTKELNWFVITGRGTYEERKGIETTTACVTSQLCVCNSKHRINSVIVDEDLQSIDRSQEQKECRHPANGLKDMRTMGHPRRFHCTRCNQTINVEDDVLLEMASNNG